MPIPNKPKLPEGTVHFEQHNLPGIAAGAYRLSMKSFAKAGSKPEENYSAEEKFAVVAPRFSLGPSDVFSVYPANGATGNFANSFPHITLRNQSLPWMRFPTKSPPKRRVKDVKIDADVPTWLALLLVSPSDFEKHGEFSFEPISGEVGDFFKDEREDGEPVRSYFKPGDQLGGFGHKKSDLCQYIDLPAELFQEIAPTVEDLKMTAHIRVVDIKRKPSEQGNPPGRPELSEYAHSTSFSLVFGTRIPNPDVEERSHVYLVSLEGLHDLLPDETTGNPKTPLSSGFVRLACLRYWNFTSTLRKTPFVDTLKALKPKLKRAKPKDAADFSIGLDAPDLDPQNPNGPENALRMGYTAMRHQTRDGGHTVSWYRGPLVPFSIETDTLPSALTSADAATRYNPETGMFDMSYSVAWRLGQLLALRDRRFAAAVFNWRRGNLREHVHLQHKATLGAIMNDFRDDETIGPLLRAFVPQDVDEHEVEAPQALAMRGVADLTAESAEITADGLDEMRSTDAMTAAFRRHVGLPENIRNWLAKLRVLDGVPFHHLVPDERMLPPESLRFFFVDKNWIEATIDGALSIGRQAASDQDRTLERAHDRAARPMATPKIESKARGLRNEAFGIEKPGEGAKLENVHGFLLRSEVVAAFPGLEVEGYSADGTQLEIVRFERLAPDVLICLFEKDDLTLAKVDIHEPPEGLHFGVTDKAPKSMQVHYNFSGASHKPGDLAEKGDVTRQVKFREGSNDRVARIFELARMLYNESTGGNGLEKYIKVPENARLGYLPSSEMGLQLLKGVGMVHFNHEPAP